jgi:predicted lipoprotein
MDIRMKVSAPLRAVAAGLVLLMSLAACARVPGVYTYEPRSSGAGAGGAKAFNAKTYVDGVWASKIVPTVRDKAVDVTTVAAAIAKDPEAAGKQYGHQAGTGSPYAYLVKGSGTVTKIDRSVPTGPMTVEVPRAGAKPLTISIATGPVIAGTALRDGVGFISFGDFTNQIAYADVANQLNNRAKTDVIAKVDLTTITGKKITFAGAFSALTPGTIFLVPTELQVTG